MKGRMLAVVIGLSCTNCYAENLLCQGKMNMPEGHASEDSRVLTMDFNSLAASMETFHGKAFGVLIKGDKTYTGKLAHRPRFATRRTDQ
jgi:hypothetical protein